jgi:4-hydroxyphenylpyruvate dioxygenase-like putative hemolysin
VIAPRQRRRSIDPLHGRCLHHPVLSIQSISHSCSRCRPRSTLNPCSARRVLTPAPPESDASFKGYVSGNEEPGRGFGHIAITVDNLEAACKRFDELGVKFKKRPEDGRMRVGRYTTALLLCLGITMDG